MVMHEDEHEILKRILRNALGDDECSAMLVPGEQSDTRRAADRQGVSARSARTAVTRGPTS